MSPKRDSDENTPIDHPLEPGERDKMIRQIHKALIGDPLSLDRDKRGIIAIHSEMHRDFYGDPEQGIVGVKVMTQKLWDMRLKMAGAIALGSVVASLAAWLIENLILGKH